MTRNQSGLDNRTKIHEKSNDVQCLGVGFSDLHFVLNAACLERLCALQHVRCNDASTQDCKGWNCPGAIPLQLIHAPLAGCRRYNSYDYSVSLGANALHLRCMTARQDGLRACWGRQASHALHHLCGFKVSRWLCQWPIWLMGRPFTDVIFSPIGLVGVVGVLSSVAVDCEPWWTLPIFEELVAQHGKDVQFVELQVDLSLSHFVYPEFSLAWPAWVLFFIVILLLWHETSQVWITEPKFMKSPMMSNVWGLGFSDLHFVLNAACLERLCALQHVRCNDASTQDCKGLELSGSNSVAINPCTVGRGAGATTATIIPCLWGQRTASVVYESKTRWATCLLGTQASHALPHLCGFKVSRWLCQWLIWLMGKAIHGCEF